MKNVLYFNSNNHGSEVAMSAMVESSTVLFVYWSNIANKDGAMVITFKNGSRYRYENVESDTFAKLISAESVGKKFNEIIKGKYEYQLTE